MWEGRFDWGGINRCMPIMGYGALALGGHAAWVGGPRLALVWGARVGTSPVSRIRECRRSGLR